MFRKPQHCLHEHTTIEVDTRPGHGGDILVCSKCENIQKVEVREEPKDEPKVKKPFRTFEVGIGPHPPMAAIQAHDMSLDECRLLRGIILNNWTTSKDYQACHPAGVFLQGYEEPHIEDRNDGWVLVEFWCSADALIHNCVQHINKRFEAFSKGDTL